MSSWIKKNISVEIADYLFNIRMNLPDRGLFQRDARLDLSIDFDSLEKQLEEAPEMLAFWDLLLSEQTYKVAVLERRSEQIRGDVVNTLITDKKMANASIRRSDIDDILNVDEEVLIIDTSILREKRVEARIKSVVKALQSKCEILRSLAGFKKQEKAST